MTRRLTLLFSAFEALLVVAIGVAIPLVPLTIVWAAQFGFAPDWAIFWRGAVDIWLIGHGVDVTFTLDPATAAALQIAGAGAPVKITIALLGFALLTLLLGVRAGERVAETGHRALGELATLGVFAAASLAVTLTAVNSSARPSIWQGALLPTLVFGVGLFVGVLREGRERGPDAAGSSLRDWIDDWRPAVRAAVGGALRAGTAAVALTILVSAVAVSLLIAVDYAQIVRLYESLHTGVVGGLALTAGQLAFVPNLVIWAASWFVGPGFAIGAGSHVSPLGTALGPMPAIPLLGALPTGDLAFGFAGLLVPVVAGFLAGAAVRPIVVRALDDADASHGVAFLVTALGGGLAGGALLGLLSAASAGAAGPGRFQQVGPDPWAVGIAAGIEFAVAIGIGLAASSRMPRRR
ncbi:DUF6350 family protein [Lysinimonas soli]|uniref:DUF6350 family protein n=1 Tax=Lysinimonas soli TaxID=1074233 RepID=A0ABW0NS01_9MICO